jgi:hypothetical protein
MGTNRRVLILADSDNTFLAAQSFNRRLDWQKLRDYLADPRTAPNLGLNSPKRRTLATKQN